MRLTISSRHMEMTDALRSHVESRVEKVRCHFDRVIDAEVVLDVEKHRHIAEVTLHANGVRMHSKESSTDMYASIDAAVDKLHRQIHKFKDRVGRRAPVKLGEILVAAEAAAQATNGKEPVDGVAAVAARPRIHHETISMQPMTVDEALVQLELSQDPFLVFTNSETQQVNVLYTRDDGSYGHIEPQY